MFALLIGFGIMASLEVPEAASVGKQWTYKELRDLALQNSPDLQNVNKAYDVKKYEARRAFSSFLPELGLEGGVRSDREKEKRNDHFYYGYGRWNLFNGGKDFSVLRKEIKASDLASLKKVAQRNQFFIKIADVFHNLYLMDRQLELKKSDFEVGEKQIQMAKKKLQGGLTTRTDILEFELHQRLLKSDLELLKVDRKALAAEMATLVGLNSSENLLVSPHEEFENKSPLPDKAEILRMSLENSLEFKEAEFANEAARFDKNRALGEYLPSVDIEGKYGKLSETDFWSSRKNSWAITGMVRLPLFTGLSHWNQFQSSKSDYERKELELLQARRRLEAKVSFLLERFSALTNAFDLAVQNQDTAKRYYASTLSEYQRGVKNSPDLAGATDRFFEARLRVYELEGDLHLTRLEIAGLTGKDEI